MAAPPLTRGRFGVPARRFSPVGALIAAAWLATCGSPSFAADGSPVPQRAPAVPVVDLSRIRWLGPVGFAADQPNNMYTLMGAGFLRRPTSPDFDRIVAEWLASHPEAKVVVVDVSGPLLEGKPESTLVYVWIVDGAENLNVHLVERGACEGAMMQPFGTVLVDPEPLESFRLRVLEAGQRARAARLGIWADGFGVK